VVSPFTAAPASPQSPKQVGACPKDQFDREIREIMLTLRGRTGRFKLGIRWAPRGQPSADICARCFADLKLSLPHSLKALLVRGRQVKSPA
jgi:hypothetical protein